LGRWDALGEGSSKSSAECAVLEFKLLAILD